MKIENDTSYSKAEIRRFIAMARPPGTKIGLVIVRNSKPGRGGKGFAWTYTKKISSKIKVWVPRKNSVMCREIWQPRKAYLGMALGSRDETLLMLLAHELRHLWQGQGKDRKRRKGMVWGAKGRFSERDADAWALHRVRQYRRGELK